MAKASVEARKIGGRGNVICKCGRGFSFKILVFSDGVAVECDHCGNEYRLSAIVDAANKYQTT